MASSFDAKKSLSFINQVPRRNDWESRSFARPTSFRRFTVTRSVNGYVDSFNSRDFAPLVSLVRDFWSW
jgi:hypothetical protein